MVVFFHRTQLFFFRQHRRHSPPLPWTSRRRIVAVAHTRYHRSGSHVHGENGDWPGLRLAVRGGAEQRDGGRLWEGKESHLQSDCERSQNLLRRSPGLPLLFPNTNKGIPLSDVAYSTNHEVQGDTCKGIPVGAKKNNNGILQLYIISEPSQKPLHLTKLMNILSLTPHPHLILCQRQTLIEFR
ncbi:hypothetical protein RIF29_18269 [Crotalaria pallida]|uniref:Uncharacterized protein n=1 Tax=Crotalaria pallida TaxID=3830 RepID=A0AAN9IG24_CROPI